jgi:hypothetical protein
MNRSRNCSDKKPDRFTAMHWHRADQYPFPSDPVKEDPVPETRQDIRSVQERYRDYRKSVGDTAEYKFEEEEE